MFKHYFRIGWRNLVKNKVFTAVNIAGLAIGLTCCLFMALYIRHEVSYDSFQPKADRTVRMIMEYGANGKVNKGNYTSTKVGPLFVRSFPEVEEAVRMTSTKRVVKYGDKLFTEKAFLFADSTFFNVFENRFVRGDAKTALNGPNKVVLTEATAAKYFGTEDPVGKTLLLGADGLPFTVTGVMKDYPSASQIAFDFLASFSSLGASQDRTFWDANFTTYLLLRNKEAIASLQEKIPGFMKKEGEGDTQGNGYITFWLEHLRWIHLHSEYAAFVPNNSITYVYIVGAVAVLMLLIACFTYINLSTARATERAKEVGLRKVVGAEKRQLFWQFISESVLLTLAALLIAIAAVAALLPAFNSLADKELHLRDLFSPVILGFAAVVLLCISLLAGSYPALVLTRFQPVAVLKGAFKNSASALTLRRSLIVFQFVISVVLIVSTLIIQNQLRYIQTKNLGYNREHIIVLPADAKTQEKIATVRSLFKANPQVLQVARAYNPPTEIVGGYSMRSEAMPANANISVIANLVDDEFVPATGLQFISGGNFSAQDVADVMVDSQAAKRYHFILNESAARELGWSPQEAIGKKMFLGDHRPGYVKGVVKDFHFASLHESIKPLVLFTDGWMGTLLVKVSGKDLPNTIAYLQAQWKTLVPHRPFEYSFLDEEYNKLYSAELRLGKVLGIFTGIAVLLACLGLFGLSAFVIQQRTKEIGIRKVLGASVAGVVVLLSKDFLRLVAVAMLIAFPLGAWVLNKWLQGFAYRVGLNAWLFAAAAVLALLVTLLTVSFQAVRAATANPVKSLRTE